MEEMKLPEGFLENMKRLLGDEVEAFLDSFNEGRRNALRVNLLKLTPERFEKTAPFPIEKVPWTENGYYVDYRDAPGRHPWYRAGVYYLQEPSAMAPAQILPVEPGDRVLDLCAAPGGKATELGARLGGRGILVANEISSSRVRALVRNIELFGITNAVVTNETPGRLAQRFEGYFDKVLVDAPCSGEGMFRKDMEAAKAWYPEKVSECASIQQEIILRAADMLRPGGYMVYSTCTFEPEENELTIAHLLRERPDMELLEIPCTGGRASFTPAYSVAELQERGFGVFGTDKDLPLSYAVRIWPHHAHGEGHFAALLHKKGMMDETRSLQQQDRIGKKRKKGSSCNSSEYQGDQSQNVWRTGKQAGGIRGGAKAGGSRTGGTEMEETEPEETKPEEAETEEARQEETAQRRIWS